MHESDIADDWKWQIANRISTREQLEEHVELTDEERAAFGGEVPLSFAVTPHYARLLNHEAIRKTVLPTAAENHLSTGELADPLGEEAHRAAPHLIHTYPDKVLFLATTFCSTYCRYCTRSRMVGKPPPAFEGYEESFSYIEQHTEIRDVLISGGDPLTMTDPVLDELLERIRSIPHVRTVRIGSKVPVVLPMRITDELCAILRRHRVWLSLHFIHPAELTPETQAACRRLSDHGVGMVSQTVLLKEVNDDTGILTDLFYGLLEINVKPYYLLQCDPVRGSARFRTTVEKGIELIRSLHGNLSGLAVPQYVIDAPGGGGKVPLLSTKQIHREGNDMVFTNYKGEEYRYPDPPELKNSKGPLDVSTLPPGCRVMVLAPHPDDFDAVAVTMRLFHDNESPIRIAVVSGSASGVLDEYSPGADNAAKARFREEEQRDSARAFGLPDDHLRFLRLPEDQAGDPIEDAASEAAVADAMRWANPDVVFLPHGCDSNPGHQRVFAMFRRLASEWRQPLTAFYIRDPKTLECRLDTYLPFGEEAAQWKAKLLRMHRTQQHRNLTLRGYGFDERLLQVNRSIATDIGCAEPYAEAFELEFFKKD